MTRFAIATAKDRTKLNMRARRSVAQDQRQSQLQANDTLGVRVMGVRHCFDGPNLGHVGAKAIAHGQRQEPAALLLPISISCLSLPFITSSEKYTFMSSLGRAKRDPRPEEALDTS